MHDLRALIEVADGFLILTCVYLHNTTVQVIVLLIENVLFVVVGLFRLFCVRLIVTLISALGGVRPRLELSIELDDFIWVQVADVLKLVLLLLIRWLLHAESQIIALRFALFVRPVLLFASANGAYLVDFGALGARNHLGVLVLDGRVVHDLREMLVVLLPY